MGNARIFFPCQAYLGGVRPSFPRKSKLSTTGSPKATSLMMNHSPLLEEKTPIFQMMMHMSFDDFECIYLDFQQNLLAYLREMQRMHGIDQRLSWRFQEAYARHLVAHSAELHCLHWFYDARWREILEEFHYPVEALASLMSPGLKTFRNLRLRSRILVTDERILHFLNIIREDLEDENNKVTVLLRDLAKIFQECFSESLVIGKLRMIPDDSKERQKESMIKVIRHLIIGPIKEMITFLYDRVVRMLLHGLNNSNLEEHLYEITEQMVFRQKFGIYETIQNLLFFENHPNRKVLRDYTFTNKAFQDLNSNQYEIDDEFKVSENYYAKAIDMLRKITKKRSSHQKVRVLYEICEEVSRELTKANEKFDAKVSMNADNILPLFIFLIVKSKNSNLHQDVIFCEHFAREPLEGDFIFCIFKSALQYVTLLE